MRRRVYRKKKQYKVILTLHPRTKNRIKEHELGELLDPLLLTQPIGFLDMMMLERNAEIVLTDSGGVQKEAFLQGTPCVTVRDETEWVELLECGWNCLANPSCARAIIEAVESQTKIDKKRERPLLYGDGHAAERIINHILSLSH